MTTTSLSRGIHLLLLAATCGMLALQVQSAEHQQVSMAAGEPLDLMPLAPIAHFAGEPYLARLRRQITMVEQPPAGGAQQPPASPGSGGGFGSFLTNLGPQLEQAKAFSSLFSSSSSSKQQSANGAPADAASAGGPSASQVLSQLTSLVRSSQGGSQSALQGAQQQGAQQASQVQGGLQAALTEMVQGLQRIAMSNPSLLPEVKNLFSQVSTKLSSAGAPPVAGAPVAPTSG